MNPAVENILTQLTRQTTKYELECHTEAVPDLVHGQRGTDLLIKISATCVGQTEGKPKLCTQIFLIIFLPRLL